MRQLGLSGVSSTGRKLKCVRWVFSFGLPSFIFGLFLPSLRPKTVQGVILRGTVFAVSTAVLWKSPTLVLRERSVAPDGSSEQHLFRRRVVTIPSIFEVSRVVSEKHGRPCGADSVDYGIVVRSRSGHASKLNVVAFLN